MDVERIKILSSEIVDEDLKEITDYLITREDMNEKYLNEEKSIKQMVTFINDTAKKELIKKRKSGFAGIRDETVFGWAIHYWDEPNDKLGINKAAPKSSKKSSKKVANDTSEEAKPKIQNKKWQPEGQLSIFDF